MLRLDQTKLGDKIKVYITLENRLNFYSQEDKTIEAYVYSIPKKHHQEYSTYVIALKEDAKLIMEEKVKVNLFVGIINEQVHHYAYESLHNDDYKYYMFVDKNSLIDSVISSANIKLEDKSCRNKSCQRKNTPGDKKCWWCKTENPC